MIKNRTFQTVAEANFFATLGVSLFNIILLTYAKDSATPHLFVSIVSVATILPSVLGTVTGRLADGTRAKSHWLIGSKLIQAGLYLGLAQIINQRTVGVFYGVVAINVISDVLGNYGGNLLTIIIQARIPSQQRQQVLGWNQSIGTVIAPVGQALGVLILAQTHNYALAGELNAGAFLLSAGCLLWGRRAIHTTVERSKKVSRGQAQRVLKQVLRQISGLSLGNFLGILMTLNIVTMSLDGVLNLALLQLAPRWQISYSIAILMVNVTFFLGSVLGGVTKRTPLDRASVFQLLAVTIMVTALAFAFLRWWPQPLPILSGVFLTAFCGGKLNPVVFARMMALIDPQLTGTIFGTVSSLVTLAAPVGSVGIILLYNLVGAKAAFETALLIAGIALIWLGLAHRHSAGE